MSATGGGPKITAGGSPDNTAGGGPDGGASGSPKAGRVRPAGARDLDRVAALFSLLIEHHTSGQRMAQRIGAEDEIRAWFASRIDAASDGATRVLVFESGENLPGLCVASLRVRPAIFRETQRGEIEHLFVRDTARRRGIGRVLVEEALGWLDSRGVSRVEVQVDRANSEGGAFWRALGFDPVMDVLERPL